MLSCASNSQFFASLISVQFLNIVKFVFVLNMHKIFSAGRSATNNRATTNRCVKQLHVYGICLLRVEI